VKPIETRGVANAAPYVAAVMCAALFGLFAKAASKSRKAAEAKSAKEKRGGDVREISRLTVPYHQCCCLAYQ